MYKSVSTLAIVALLSGLTACQDAGPKETMGGILGGVAGGVLGSQIGKGTGTTVAVIAGTMLGAGLGSSIGKSLDDVDKMKLKQANQTALETVPDGGRTTWRNPNTGNSGAAIPTRTWTDNDGTPCREFTQEVVIGGKTESAYGTACRQADGSWKIKS